jgi:hypothetical protein
VYVGDLNYAHSFLLRFVPGHYVASQDGKKVLPE